MTTKPSAVSEFCRHCKKELSEEKCEIAHGCLDCLDVSVPMEFWLIYEAGYSPWISDKPLHSADTIKEIHVIEYSAYADIQRECDRLNKMLEYEKQREHLTKSQREMELALDNFKLTEENEKLREALKFNMRPDANFSNPSHNSEHIHALVSYEVFSRIKKALAKDEGGIK